MRVDQYGGAHILMASNFLNVRMLAPFQKVVAKEWESMAVGSFGSRSLATLFHGSLQQPRVGVRVVSFPGPVCDPAAVSAGEQPTGRQLARSPWCNAESL